MISTQTRGVGRNRNLALSYANADICLFADDDVCSRDDVEKLVTEEFEAHPDADVMIFHLETDDAQRALQSYRTTRKCRAWERKPWGSVRVAVRLSAVKRANVWFTTLFGGGCVFPAGEDSIWIREAWKKGLRFYVSDKTIGKVSFDTSTWFTGYDEKLFFGKGAYCKAVHPVTYRIWLLYYLWRYAHKGEMKAKQKLRWMKIGAACYPRLMGYDEYCASMEEKRG